MGKIFLVPVVWSMYGHVPVTEGQAKNEKEAMKYVTHNADEFALPTDGAYLEESFEVDEAGTVRIIEMQEGGNHE